MSAPNASSSSAQPDAHMPGEAFSRLGVFRPDVLSARVSRGFKSLPAWPFLAGVFLGFLLCCVAGRMVSERKLFQDFLRLFQPIQPQTFFYPTASELTYYVRRTVPKDKILVLVGGASYFRGTGQNRGELWTLELQRLLGDRYRVVNFAIDQAGMTDFSGAAFQILAQEYPRIIYVSNSSPLGNGNDGVDGLEIYRYIFWDAYYKGMFKPVSPWIENVHSRARAERLTSLGLEMHLGKWIDARTYSCDLWTYIGYNYFFTVWSDITALSPFRARRLYQESVDPNMVQHQTDTRKNKEYAQIYEERNKAYFQNGLVQGKNGIWEPWPDTWKAVSNVYQDLFPDNLKPKCLVVLLRPNTFFMQSFTEGDRQCYEMVFRLGQDIIQKLGYQVVQAGANCTPDDYIDAGHFMASGGRKVARTVAGRIQQMFPDQ
jgi:hypothetical protein